MKLQLAALAASLGILAGALYTPSSSPRGARWDGVIPVSGEAWASTPVFTDSNVLRGSVIAGKCLLPWVRSPRGVWETKCGPGPGGPTDCYLSWNVTDTPALQTWSAGCGSGVRYVLIDRNGSWDLEVY